MGKWLKLVASRSFCLIVFGLIGCSTTNDSKTKPVTSTSQSGSGAQKSQALGSKNISGSQDKSSLEALRRGDAPTTPAGSALKEVYFEFDRYDLSTDTRATLKTAADWLKKNPATRVELEGHCDERGTSEYNLALGAKRAQAAKDYLMTLGITANRLSTTSFGEEIPVCREHSEDCWQKIGATVSYLGQLNLVFSTLRPAVTGDLVTKLLVGKLSLLGFGAFDYSKADPSLEMLAQLGVVLLLFEVSLDANRADLMKVG